MKSLINKFASAAVLLTLLAGYSATSSAKAIRSYLVGRTVCLENGINIAFRGDGTASSNRFGTGTWVLQGNHIVFTGPNSYFDVIVSQASTPNGVLHFHTGYFESDIVYCN